MPQPLERGLSWQFGKPGAASLESSVIGLASVPMSGVALIALGVYTTLFEDAWRVRSVFGGVMADAYGAGIIESWYAPGVGLVRQTANSQAYELVGSLNVDEAIQLDSSYSNGGHKVRMPIGQVAVVRLRGVRAASASGVSWELTNWEDVAAAGVLAPRSDGGAAGEFFADFEGSRKLNTGEYVFVFEKRTAGRATLTFTASDGVGRKEFEIFTSPDEETGFELSEASVRKIVTATGATVTIRVHYVNEDGTKPTLSRVAVQGGMLESYPMKFVEGSGTYGDGDYETVPPVTDLALSSGMHRYDFYFSTDEGDRHLQHMPEEHRWPVSGSFEIAGPMPCEP